MPPVAGWRDTRLPATMSAADVTALLDACDRSRPSGLRDLAILTLLARLGLRSGEVAALQLGDIDWRAGEIVVRGKARCQDRLPLTVEAGEAVAGYLQGRPSPLAVPGGDLDLVCALPRDPSQLDHPGGLPRLPAGRAAPGGRAPAASRAGQRDAAPGQRPGRDQPGAPAPGPGHHLGLCQGGPGRAADRGPPVAGAGR